MLPTSYSFFFSRHRLCLSSRILPRIRHLILQHLNELVEQHREQTAYQRPHPVDPMLLVVRVSNDAWPQASCRVEAATRVEDADQLGNEKAQADPTGAMNVALCFSLPSRKIVKMSSNVRSASMNRPWSSEAPPARVVRTLSGVGNMTRTRALAAMPPATWAAKRQIARVRGMELTMTWRM
jgi:hypothetical protein